MIRTISPAEGAVLSLHTDTHRAFFAAEESRAAMSGELSFQWNNLAREGEDHSAPAPVMFRWEGAPGAEVTLTEGGGVRKLKAADGECTVSAYNLIPGRTYTWQVAGGEAAHFTTAMELPRWILAPGLTNIRDMGGYETADGRHVVMEKLYRGSELDSHCIATPEAIRVVTEELNIRTDLDLRGEIVGKRTDSVLTPYGVDWVLIPIYPYDEILQEAQWESYRKSFSVLADPAAYPLYFHCWGGADRAGTFAFMIHALLGVSLPQLICDYELTSLSVWGMRVRNYPPFANLVQALLQLGDGDIQKGAEAHLLRTGVTKEQIASIKSILLE